MLHARDAPCRGAKPGHGSRIHVTACATHAPRPHATQEAKHHRRPMPPTCHSCHPHAKYSRPMTMVQDGTIACSARSTTRGAAVGRVKPCAGCACRRRSCHPISIPGEETQLTGHTRRVGARVWCLVCGEPGVVFRLPFVRCTGTGTWVQTKAFERGSVIPSMQRETCLLSSVNCRAGCEVRDSDRCVACERAEP